MRKLTHKELIERQTEIRTERKTIPLTVVLNNIRSLYNVGSIFRTADGVGVEKIWLCGITGKPPESKISKTALGAEKTVPWEHRWNVLEVIEEMKKAGYEIVLLEQMEKSVPYQDYCPAKPVCLVLGNEIHGVEDDLGKHCDRAIEIEMVGLKNSLNVTVAFGIVAYHIREKVKVKSQK